MEILVLTVVAGAAFMATSLDSLFVLVPALAARPDRVVPISIGYLAALVLIVVVSWGLASAGEDLLPYDGGLLGIIPVALGIWMMVRSRPAFEEASSETGSDGVTQGVTKAKGFGVWGMALLTLSLSGDNFAAFIPLLADTNSGGDRVVGVVLVAWAGVWVGVALLISRRSALRFTMERWGGRVLPILLISVGLYILANTPFDLR